MNINEAKSLAMQGERVAHIYFSPEEWLTMPEGFVVFEDGCECSWAQFISTRQDDEWKEGWIVWNEKQHIRPIA